MDIRLNLAFVSANFSFPKVEYCIKLALDFAKIVGHGGHFLSDFGGCHRVTLMAVAKADYDGESKCRRKLHAPEDIKRS